MEVGLKRGKERSVRFVLGLLPEPVVDAGTLRVG